jgi:hypothetical protein
LGDGTNPLDATAGSAKEDKLMKVLTELERELLAALENMLNLTLDEDDIAVSSRIAKARAVIARARAKEQADEAA